MRYFDRELLERDLDAADAAVSPIAESGRPAAQTRFLIRARAGQSAEHVRGAVLGVSERFAVAPLFDPELFDPAELSEGQRRTWTATLAIDPVHLSRDPLDLADTLSEHGRFERVRPDNSTLEPGPVPPVDEGPDGLSGGGGSGGPPPRREWALEQLRVPEAWPLVPGRGKGVRIGHLDTGYAAHDEWERSPLAIDQGYNFVSGIADPLDPLWSGPFLHPGHGTATASVIVGARQICGVAPGAELVPIRCISSVIVGGIGGGEAELTQGVRWAVKKGCRVISMSLGGYIMMWDLWEACVEAIQHNVIIVAASGNKAGLFVDGTVFPAKFEELIAVSATTAEGQPWSDACCTPWGRLHYAPHAHGLVKGGHVDITAPGHDLWRALREPADGGATNVAGVSSGTSYATAHVAGLAALWLARHYPDGFTEPTGCAQRMFLSELQRTCTPGGGNGWHGPGIANAERLIRESPHGRAPITRGMGRAP